ncbi:MAG: AIR synthase family protein [Thaumarchaeota archaeon]|nr:AIR synthase family protein [Nitrososphaerota archaeon]
MARPTGLTLGKLPPEILKRYLLGMVGAPSKDLLVAPSIGVDFGVVRVGPGSSLSLIVSSDPVTGVEERIGGYAVNVSANDVATSGNRPRFLQSVILLPEDADEKMVARISTEMSRTAKGLGITIVGGHTELTPGLKRPIVMTTVFAFAESYVTAADAREGDSVMLTKSAAIEGTAILASEAPGLDPALVRRARGYSRKLSVVEEAVAAYGTGRVHAMHDCTEGGVLGAAYEMSYASGLGFELIEEKVPVSRETRGVCSALSLDPLRLISSGALLLSVEEGAEEEVSEVIRRKAGTRTTVVGRFRGRGGKRTLVLRNGTRERVGEPPADELWRVRRKMR